MLLVLLLLLLLLLCCWCCFVVVVVVVVVVVGLGVVLGLFVVLYLSLCSSFSFSCLLLFWVLDELPSCHVLCCGVVGYWVTDVCRLGCLMSLGKD